MSASLCGNGNGNWNGNEKDDFTYPRYAILGCLYPEVPRLFFWYCFVIFLGILHLLLFHEWEFWGVVLLFLQYTFPGCFALLFTFYLLSLSLSLSCFLLSLLVGINGIMHRFDLIRFLFFFSLSTNAGLDWAELDWSWLIVTLLLV